MHPSKTRIPTDYAEDCDFIDEKSQTPWDSWPQKIDPGNKYD
jgi:hypothetical protein